MSLENKNNKKKASDITSQITKLNFGKFVLILFYYMFNTYIKFIDNIRSMSDSSDSSENYTDNVCIIH